MLEEINSGYIEECKNLLNQEIITVTTELKTKLADLPDAYRSLVNNKIDYRCQKYNDFITTQEINLLKLLATKNDSELESETISIADYLNSNLIKPAETKIRNLRLEIENDIAQYQAVIANQKPGQIWDEVGKLMLEANARIQAMLGIKKNI